MKPLIDWIAHYRAFWLEHVERLDQLLQKDRQMTPVDKTAQSQTFNKWIRQIHRWLSIAFTVAVIANIVALGRDAQAVWVGLFGAAPARLAAVHRPLHVRAAVCHQVAQRATHRANRDVKFR
jgi:hypothetical protein